MLGLPGEAAAPGNPDRDTLQQGLAAAFPMPMPMPKAAAAAGADAQRLAQPLLPPRRPDHAAATLADAPMPGSSSAQGGAFQAPAPAQNGPPSGGGESPVAKVLQSGEGLPSRLVALAMKRSSGSCSLSLSCGTVDEDGKAQVGSAFQAHHTHSGACLALCVSSWGICIHRKWDVLPCPMDKKKLHSALPFLKTKAGGCHGLA
jgi:hypothetical protein